MRFLKFVCFFVGLLLLSGMGIEKKEITEIEGLLYLDHSPVRVEIRNGRISNIVRIPALSDGKDKVYLAPGLIDNQVNGYSGIGFVAEGEDLTQEGVVQITKALWKAGVTTYLPTLRTNGHEILLRNLSILAKAKDDPALRGSIPGYHLEGPYISPEDGYRGAHALKSVRKPNWEEFSQLYEVSGRNILQVTLAPEVEGAMEFITRLREKNIVVALGHHNATTKQITEAADRGAQTVTHLGNAMANNVNRHQNPLWPQLSEDRLMISIIGDGFHLLPEEINVFYKAKGTERVIITSDVSRYAGLPPGKYLNPEGDTIQLTKDGAARYLARNSLSGAAAPITQGVGNVMKATGCSLGEAIQMASTNPAKLYGLSDRGQIEVGMKADLIAFTIDDYKIDIKKTIVAGEVVYDSRHK